MRWRTVALLLALAESCDSLYGADIKGLQEATRIRITDRMIGSPVPGSRPASFWAVSFSPDEQYIAVGVEFTEKKSSRSPSLVDKSFLLILSMADPTLVVRKFEIPRHPAMRVYPPLRWTADSHYVATPFYNDSQHLAVADLLSGKLTVIPNEHCNLEGLLPGPQVVQSCTVGKETQLRFVNPDGDLLREWRFPRFLSVFGVEARLGRIAITTSTDMNATTHEIIVLNANDRQELGHWTLAGGAPYFGTFAQSGNSLCVLEASPVPKGTDLVCWDLTSATQTHRTPLPSGWSRAAIGGGNLVGFEHSEIWNVPKALQSIADTSYLVANSTRRIWDLRVSSETAQIPIRTQWVLPLLDAPYAWTISPTGALVAEGGKGQVTIYRVPGNTQRQSVH